MSSHRRPLHDEEDTQRRISISGCGDLERQVFLGRRCEGVAGVRRARKSGMWINVFLLVAGGTLCLNECML